MKGNKKVLTLAVLVLLLAVCFTTYAIYRQSTNGTGTIKAAAWSVTVKGQPITNNFTFGLSDITWTTHTGKNDTIAPGDSGTITIPVDATGSEVDVLVEAAIDTANASLPDGFTATVTSGTNGVATIPYAASGMTTNVVITVTWTGTLEDTAAKDGTDLAAQGSNLSIPVTLKARQKLATD